VWAGTFLDDWCRQIMRFRLAPMKKIAKGGDGGDLLYTSGSMWYSFFPLAGLDTSRTNWMRSRATRVALGAAAWMALATAAFLIVQSERTQAIGRTSVETFDARVRDVSVALTDLRTAQQAFVAPGQGYGFWASKADEFFGTVESGVIELQQRAVTADGRRSLVDALAAMTELKSIGDRARTALNEDQPFSSADTVFTEGTETAKDFAAQLEAARLAERAGADVSAATAREGQVRAATTAASVAALAIGLLMWAPSRRDEATRSNTRGASGGVDPDLWLGDRQEPSPSLPRESVPVLKAAVDLCTDLNRARALDDLTALLGRAAATMDAAGIIVWVGRPGGTSLRSVLAHGYSQESLSRMPPVARSANNAAAAAYRTGALQIVLTRPGVSSGALAAPMLSPDGCIGALTAEIKNGGETSDGVQALASIFAAQLAGLLAASVAAEENEEPARVSA
jgi:hypothetical protein